MIMILNLQKRARELGRIRLGAKETFTKRDGSQGTRPVKLDRFRITSASQSLLEKVAALYGGEVQPWTPAGGSPQFEVVTNATRLPIMVPPQPVTQWHEAWRASGCVHRCDGETNVLTDEPCDPEDPLHQEALTKPTTRLNVVLRDVEGIGVFRVETHGWNAAVEIPNAAEFLAQAGGYVNGWLALEQRTSIDNSNEKPVTRHFMVPILEIDVTPAQLMAGKGRVGAPPMIGGPAGQTPALAAAGPDYVALAADLTTADEVRALWYQARDAGHMTNGLSEHLVKRAEELKAAETGEPVTPGPVPDADGVVDAEVLDDGPEADSVWRECVEVAGAIGWSLSQLQADFEKRMGMPAGVAAAAELRAYLRLLRETDSEQVPA